MSGCDSTSLGFCRDRWHKMWVVVHETSLLAVKPKTGEIRVVMLFDKGN